MMDKTLIDYLKQVEDPRSARGKRYPLWLMLLLAVLGTLSDCHGYQALEDFCVRHYAELCARLGITPKRLPSDSSFRRLFGELDFGQLSARFNQWATEQMGLESGDWLAVDGKSIKGTVDEVHSAYQSFVNVVSVYSQRQGVVIALQPFETRKDSEIKVVERLLEQLQLDDVVFTFDALHAQKKHYS